MLAQCPGAEAWIVVFLLDPKGVAGLDQDTLEGVERGIMQFQRTVIAALLSNIRPDAPKPVLWAVAEKLDELEGGRYSYDRGLWPFLVQHVEAETEPIRDIARAVLKRSLGVDHGYDKGAWRDAILHGVPQRVQDEGGPATGPSTRR